MKDPIIKAESQLICVLCGGSGKHIYEQQRDRLFGAAGLWNFKKCSNQVCGLVWLDPMPLKEEIGKAYANYYTHATSNPSQVGLLKNIYLLLKRGYLAGRYNYFGEAAGFAVRSLGKLLYLFPLRRSSVDGAVRFLEAMPQGRLLDVGCGSGEWLLSMRELGWRAEGLDFDESAVRVARQKGLEVKLGALEDQHYPDASFDAVTLNHVIEHVPDPIQTLRECARILKKDGRLVILTPNSSSLGHRVFKQDWRGLEPPRHLHLFSMQSMRRTLELAGFRKVTLRPQIAFSVIYESVLLRQGQTGVFPPLRQFWAAWAFARLFNFVELCVIRCHPPVADCFGAIAEKEHTQA